jgi:Bacterial TSP3 repeat
VGSVLVLHGKNFSRVARNNRVYFRRASDGKTVRARARKATTRRLEVVIPQTVDNFLTVAPDGTKQPTRFQIGIFTTVFGPYTKKSQSPLIAPAGATPVTPGTPGTPPPVGPDCNKNGIPDANDTSDSDGDGLADNFEVQVGTNPCNKDTDGDGIEDGYEYFSALDLNSNARPYPGKKPYPNPLDGSDASVDFDGDGLTDAEEFAAWNLYGGRILPAPGQSFPYSGGNQTSPAAPGPGGTDYDQNGKTTDDEKDADGDGLANWVELARGSSAGGAWTAANGTPCPPSGAAKFQNCGAGLVPNGNTFVPSTATFTGAAMPTFVVGTNWLDPDTDGDGIHDLQDDQDHDDIANTTEIDNQTDPVDPCAPDTESRTCPQH